MLDFKFSRGPSRLQLLQTSDTLTAAVAEVLTETIIAYITGILFVVALIIGVSGYTFILTFFYETLFAMYMILHDPSFINEGYNCIFHCTASPIMPQLLLLLLMIYTFLAMYMILSL